MLRVDTLESRALCRDVNIEDAIGSSKCAPELFHFFVKLEDLRLNVLRGSWMVFTSTFSFAGRHHSQRRRTRSFEMVCGWVGDDDNAKVWTRVWAGTLFEENCRSAMKV